MKKSIFFIATVLAVLSCQDSTLKNDIKDSSQNIPFTFSAYSSKATKADPTQSDLNFFYDKFNVYGWKKVNNAWVTDVPVFDNVTNQYFTEDGKGSIYSADESLTVSGEWGTVQSDPAFPAWYYKGIRYWDKFATEYRFSAYAPITASNEVSCNQLGVIKIGSSENPITVESTNLMSNPAKTLSYRTFQKDYMTATSDENHSVSGASNAVSLVFTHELAKFNIKLVLDKTNVTTQQRVVVNEVKLLHIEGTSYYDNSMESETNYKSGWYKPTTELDYTVKGVGDNTDGYQMNLDIDPATEGDQNYDGYFVMERLMIPQTATKAVENEVAVNAKATAFEEECVYVKYSIGSEPYEGYYALANLFLGNGTGSSYDFLGGNEYTLTITVGPKPIYFSVSVTPWEEDNNTADLAAN